MNTTPGGITTLYDEFIPATKSDDSVPLPRTLDLGNNKLLMADALTTPTAGQYGLSLRQLNVLKNAGYSNRQIEEASERGYAEELVRDIEGPIGIV